MFAFNQVTYKDILHIDHLVIDDSKITVLIGESGGGKTTLLKLLNKSISPTNGTITYNTQPLETLNSVTHRRNVVYLTQSPYIFKGSIKDNLIKGLNYQKRAIPDDDVLKDMLKKVSLNKALDADSSTLSGGEKQRLALGRVLLLDADVYLLDEPSSALDDETEALIINTISDICKKAGKGLIMISHSKAIALKVGDDIKVVKDGRVKDYEQ